MREKMSEKEIQDLLDGILADRLETVSVMPP